MSDAQLQQFSRLRSWIFPVNDWELPKFIPLAIMMFVVAFNNNLLYNSTNAIFITAPGSGAESLSFLKLWGVLPITLLCSVCYVELRKNCSFSVCFYSIQAIFIVFFLLFNLVLYPHAKIIHMPMEWIDAVKGHYPIIQHAVPLVGNWSFALYFIFAELWSVFSLTILFWQFANDIVGPHEAKRFYPLLIFIGNVAVIALYFVMYYFSRFSGYNIIMYSNYLVVVLTICMVYVFRWLNNNVLIHEKYTSDVMMGAKDSERMFGFLESMQYLWRSEYMGLLCIIVISYNIMSSIIIQTWKCHVKELYPTLEGYYGFMTNYFFWMGVIPVLFVYIAKGMIMRYGWRAIAIITPVIVTFIGFFFFAYIVYEEYLFFTIHYFGTTNPLLFIVTLGMIGVIICKSCKYSFFDPSKEMAFIPLDQNIKAIGKVAVDGIGGPLGSSGGGLIQQCLLMLTMGDQITISPYLGIISVFIGVIWLFSVMRLSVLYEQHLER